MATHKNKKIKNNAHTFVRTYYVGLSINRENPSIGMEYSFNFNNEKPFWEKNLGLLDEKANEGKFI